VAVDLKGDVFIANSGDNCVVEVTGPFSAQRVVGSGLDDPGAVAVDTGGDVYIADTANNRVVEVAAGGQQTPVGSGLAGPAGLALDAGGDLVVADSAHRRLVIEPAGGASQTVLSTESGPPAGVAVYAPAPTFTADRLPTKTLTVGTAFSYRFAASVRSGQRPATFSLARGTLPSGLTLNPTTGVLSGKPTFADNFRFVVAAENAATATTSAQISVIVGPDAAKTPAPGTLYVTDLSNRLVELAPGGGVQKPFSAASLGLSYPAGLAVDARGDVYVADEGNDRVVEFKTTGAKVAVRNDLLSPTGVTVDTKGDVYIADTGANEVLEVTAKGTTVVASSSEGADPLSQPTGVAVDAAGDVFIADFGHANVVEVPAGGGTETTVGSGLVGPADVAVDAHGDVYIADFGAGDVVEVPPGGGPQTTVGSGLDQPDALALDAQGDVFVADQRGLIELPAGGGPELMVGSGLNQPVGVAVYAPGPVFAADTPATLATVGTAYSYAYGATAVTGEPAVTFALAGGTLPPGLTLNRGTGVLAGTPGLAGHYTFAVEAESGASFTVGPTTTISVVAAAGPNTASLRTAPANAAAVFSAAVQTAGPVDPATRRDS
jgi:sugar lactone lactonase YvrE